MYTDEKNGPMNADEKGRQYVGLLTVNCTGSDFCCICSICVTVCQ